MAEEDEDVDILHVPFRGSLDALSEVLAGRIPVSYVAVGLVMPHFKSGALTPLAVIGTVRSPLLPDVPSHDRTRIQVSRHESAGSGSPPRKARRRK